MILLETSIFWTGEPRKQWGLNFVSFISDKRTQANPKTKADNHISPD